MLAGEFWTRMEIAESALVTVQQLIVLDLFEKSVVKVWKEEDAATLTSYTNCSVLTQPPSCQSPSRHQGADVEPTIRGVETRDRSSFS